MLHRLDAEIGKLILRLTLGLLMLPHGIAKLFSGVDGIQGMLASAGLPEFIAWGVFVGEIVAPVMLIVGWYARWGGLIIVINMIFAVMLAHPGDIFALNQHGAWALELQGFFLLTGVVVMFTGPGAFAINRK